MNKKWKNVNLEWFAMYWDMNNKKLTRFNVFRHDFIDRLKKNYTKGEIHNYTTLREFIRREFLYHYWCKCEYEVLVSDFPYNGERDCEKIDVYYQLELNLDRITEYVIREINLDF